MVCFEWHFHWWFIAYMLPCMYILLHIYQYIIHTIDTSPFPYCTHRIATLKALNIVQKQNCKTQEIAYCTTRIGKNNQVIEIITVSSLFWCDTFITLIALLHICMSMFHR